MRGPALPECCQGIFEAVLRQAVVLLQGEDATVTVVHSRTTDPRSICREADILIAAIGKAEMVKGDWIKPGAAVIDVGTNPVEASSLTLNMPCRITSWTIKKLTSCGCPYVAGLQQEERVQVGGRCGLPRGQAACRLHHSRSRGRRTNDHRHAPAEYCGERQARDGQVLAHACAAGHVAVVTTFFDIYDPAIM